MAAVGDKQVRVVSEADLPTLLDLGGNTEVAGRVGLAAVLPQLGARHLGDEGIRKTTPDLHTQNAVVAETVTVVSAVVLPKRPNSAPPEAEIKAGESQGAFVSSTGSVPPPPSPRSQDDFIVDGISMVISRSPSPKEYEAEEESTRIIDQLHHTLVIDKKMAEAARKNGASAAARLADQAHAITVNQIKAFQDDREEEVLAMGTNACEIRRTFVQLVQETPWYNFVLAELLREEVDSLQAKDPEVVVAKLKEAENLEQQGEMIKAFQLTNMRSIDYRDYLADAREAQYQELIELLESLLILNCEVRTAFDDGVSYECVQEKIQQEIEKAITFYDQLPITSNHLRTSADLYDQLVEIIGGGDGKRAAELSAKAKAKRAGADEIERASAVDPRERTTVETRQRVTGREEKKNVFAWLFESVGKVFSTMTETLKGWWQSLTTWLSGLFS